MSAVITRPFPSLPGAPQAPWLRFLEGDGDGKDGTPGSTPGTGNPATGNPDSSKADDGDDPEKGDTTDWKAKSRMWEQRAKENSGAAKKLQELEDAQKSELQKANERAEKAEKRAEEAERRAQELEGKETRRELAEKVSEAKRVPVHLLMRGGGDTKESMEAYANDILSYRNGKAPGVVSRSGTDGDDKDKSKATSSLAAGRERFEARHNKTNS
jgi:hypothetical protein